MMSHFGAIALVVLSSAAAPQPEALLDTLLSQERKLIEAIKQQDRQTLEKMLGDEAYAVTPGGGRQTGAQMLKSLDEVTITSYSVSDVQLVRVSEDVGILTYKFTWAGRRGNVEVPSNTVFATSTWAQRDGEWKSVFYQETPVEN